MEQGGNRGTPCTVAQVSFSYYSLLEVSPCFPTSAALHSGPSPGWPQPRRVRGTAASHDHPTGSLLSKEE